MIAYLRGKLTVLEPTHAIVECHGVGYLLKISLGTYDQLQGKDQVLVHTYLQVREDAQVLFGFAQPEEKSLFELLISISGVGGNTALTILSSITPAELEDAVMREDTQTLKRVKGIGAKTAGRIILELKDKLGSIGGGGRPEPKAPAGSLAAKKQEALAALVSLGLPKSAMETRLETIIKTEGAEIGVEAMIKLALRNN